MPLLNETMTPAPECGENFVPEPGVEFVAPERDADSAGHEARAAQVPVLHPPLDARGGSRAVSPITLSPVPGERGPLQTPYILGIA